MVAVGRTVVGVLMLVLVAIISAEVILRFFFDVPLASVSEVAVLVFVWLSMLGAAVAVPLGAHMAINPLTKRLSSRGAIYLGWAARGVILILGAILAVSGYEHTSTVFNEALPVTGLSSAWEVAAFPICGALIVIFTLLGAARDVSRLRGRRGD
jgi:TRAP-type C4-dicarboxylate transport system permease small subunit